MKNGCSDTRLLPWAPWSHPGVCLHTGGIFSAKYGKIPSSMVNVNIPASICCHGYWYSGRYSLVFLSHGISSAELTKIHSNRSTYHITQQRATYCACLNKRTPWPLTFPGYISETAELFSIKFSALMSRYSRVHTVSFIKKDECGYNSSFMVSFKSGKDKGSLPASMPGVFIRRNMVYENQTLIWSGWLRFILNALN